MTDLSQRIATLPPERQRLLEQMRAAQRRAQPPLQPRAVEGPAPLSFTQQRLWVLAQLQPDSTAYNYATGIRLVGALNVEALQQAIHEIVRRHTILRTTIEVDGDGPRQVVQPWTPEPLPIVDLTSLPLVEREPTAQTLLQHEAMRPFDLERGPLLRTVLLRLEAREAILLFTLHHIITDGWSIALFIRELSTIYRAWSTGQPSPLPELSLQYADFADWQQRSLTGQTYEQLRAYWTTKLQNLPSLSLPLDRPRPALQTYRGVSLAFQLPRSLSRALRNLARTEGTSLFMLFSAAFAVLLSRYSGQHEIVLGTLVANRRQRQIEHLIGYFVNVLVLRLPVQSTARFQTLLQQTRETILEAFEHQEFPFEALIEELRPARDLSRTPLVQVLLVLQQAPAAFDLPELSVTPVNVDLPTAQFDLTLEMRDGADDLTGAFQYNVALFNAETIERMQAQFQILLEAIVADPQQQCRNVPLATPAELHRLLEWSTSPTQPVPATCIHEHFALQAARTPDAIALVDGERQISYRALNRRATQLARHLLRCGVKPETPVGVYLNRSIELVVGLLGILKAGGCYVPLDPRYPEERLRWMLHDSGARILLSESRLYDATRPLAEQVWLLDRDWAQIATAAGSIPDAVATPDSVAYIIYTSGSTGQPKGVLGLHRGAINRFNWMWRAYPFAAHEVACHKTALSFVDSVWEMFGPLLAGVPLVLLPPAVDHDPEQLIGEMARAHVTRLVLVPSLLRLLLETFTDLAARLPRLKLWITSGEALTEDLARRFQQQLPGRTLLNLYGSSEVAADVTAQLVDHHLADVAIGRPIDNMSVYVLDQERRLVPPGVPGELYVGGVGLARGYHRQPGLTAEKFVPHPLGSLLPTAPGERLYQTGDVVRYRSNSALAFLGRVDHQVQVRGHRVELAEVERIVRQHPQVAEAVAIAYHDRAATTAIAAYVVPAPGQRPTPESLRRFFGERAPAFMVPAVWLYLAELPLTPNGKVNRNALPAPTLATPPADDHVEQPRTPTETAIAELWMRLLARPQIGLDQDFFTLGGHSILATQMILLLREQLQIDLQLKDIFEAPTIAQLAARIDQQERTTQPTALPALVAVPGDWFDPFPLTDVQQAYWIGRSAELELGNVATHSYAEIDVPALHLERFTSALQRLIARHHMLRAIIQPDGQQRVLATTPPYVPALYDLRDLPGNESDAERAAIRERMSHQVLPTDRWPLFEICVSRVSGAPDRIHLSMDALICDVWSYQVLMRELSQLYHVPSSTLPALEITFRDYVVAEQALKTSDLYQQSAAYWEHRITDLPPGPELPLAHSPAALAAPRFQRWAAELDADSWSQLKQHAVEQGLTPSGVLLAAFTAILTCWSRRSRYTLTLTLFNRLLDHPQLGLIVGDFTSLTLLEIDDTARVPFAERARRLQSRLWEDLDHRYVSGVQVMREWSRRQTKMPGAAMPVVFTSNLEQSAALEEQAPPPLGTLHNSITQTPQVLLDHQVSELEGRLLFNWDVVAELFPPALVDTMFEAYHGLLQRLAADPALWKRSDLALLPPDQQQLRIAVNATERSFPLALLHQLVAEQAALHPERLAIVSAERSMSYGELVQFAHRIGQRLRALGAQPNSLIAVVLPKGWEQVVAVLGILHAGAAYLPIDPDLPAERITYLLQHGSVRLVLTKSTADRRIAWPEHVQRFPVDLPEIWADQPITPPKPIQQLTDLAYVIFTSGSTGLPKGVMIDHQGAANTILDLNQRFGVGPDDRVLAISALSFDLSVYDIFGTLAAGATIVMPTHDRLRDPQHWAELVLHERVTIWNSVPALLKLLAEHVERRDLRALDSLRLVMLSGDWIPVDLPPLIQELSTPVQIFSLGGATEASIWSIFFPIEQVDPAWRSIPYGRALDNQQMWVLSDHFTPRPDWVPGQIYIGGVGLAKGYWRDAAKTAASFVIDPHTGARLYRTGDLGRYLPDGNIEFLGREDFQVKINGYRIELGEIEAALTQLDAIQAAIVIVAGDPRGNKRLVAYYVPAGGTTLTTADLRRQLQERLPAYMLPAIFVALERLPLTANGKVDRQALPPPEAGPVPQPASPLAADEISQALATIWTDALKVEQAAPNASFFDLGGNSLIAIRLLDQVQAAFGVKIPLSHLLNDPTVSGLALAIGEARQQRHTDTPLPTLTPDIQRQHESFPLTDIQYAYWFGRQGAVVLGNIATHSYVEIDVAQLDLDRLNLALERLIERHGMLRMIVQRNGQQQILEQIPPYSIAAIDLRAADQATAEMLLTVTRDRMSHQIFATDRWPLFELVAHRLDEQWTRLHISVDLLIADALSFQLMQQELLETYHNPEFTQPPLTSSFRDYVLAITALQKSERYQQSQRYWEQRILTLPPAPALPLATSPGLLRKPQFMRRQAEIPPERWTRLKARASTMQITPSGLLCAAFAEVLAAYSATPRFTLNLTTFQRLPLHPDVDHMVGDFTSTTLLAVERSRATFAERAQELQEQMWRDLEHRLVSGVAVLRQLRQRHPQREALLMPVVFTSTLIHNLNASAAGMPTWQTRPVFSVSQTPQVLLDHQVFEFDDILLLSWDTVESAFPRGMIQTMFDTYVNLLTSLAEDADLWRSSTLWDR